MSLETKIKKLGTSIEITVILEVPSADTAKITIKDPCLASKVTDASMTKTADNVYTYIYQSATTDVEGDYEVTITLTKGAYTSINKKTFTLEE